MIKLTFLKDAVTYFRSPEHLEKEREKERAEARKEWRKEAHDELKQAEILETLDQIFSKADSENLRSTANKEILHVIGSFLDQNPDLRFNQALIALDVVRDEHDDFNTEPWEIRRRIDVRLKELNKAADEKKGKK